MQSFLATLLMRKQIHKNYGKTRESILKRSYEIQSTKAGLINKLSQEFQGALGYIYL